MPREHWMHEVVGEVRARMHEAVPYAVNSLRDTMPYAKPPKPPEPPSLDLVMQASPDERQQMLATLPPEKASEIAQGWLKEAEDRYGPSLSRMLAPAFELDQLQSQLTMAGIDQATGAGTEVGIQQGMDELSQLMGINPLAP